jgi:hypothetical protein
MAAMDDREAAIARAIARAHSRPPPVIMDITNFSKISDKEKNDRFKEIDQTDEVDFNQTWLFRALRPDELYTALKQKRIVSACEMLPQESPEEIKRKEECKRKTVSQHVTSGTKADVKSDYISLTRSPKVAALWSCRRGAELSENLMSGVSSGIFAAIDSDSLELIPVTDDLVRGISGMNAANKSQEILVKKEIPMRLLRFYQSIEVSPGQYAAYEGFKYWGYKTTKDEKAGNPTFSIIQSINKSKVIYTDKQNITRYETMIQPMYPFTFQDINEVMKSLTKNAVMKEYKEKSRGAEAGGTYIRTRKRRSILRKYRNTRNRIKLSKR